MNVALWLNRSLLVVLLLGGLSGCKTGTSFGKPTWWSFGGGGNAEAEKLASAPPYGEAAKAADGSLVKPSASATPYPTTTTPQSYAVSGPGTAPASVAAAPPAAGDAPITYGKTPPPAMAAAPVAAPAAAAASAAPIAAQTGPYATIPAAPPAPAAAIPITDPAAVQPSSRIADARGFEPAGVPPAAPTASAFGAASQAAPPPAPLTSDSRYGSALGSRFSGEPSTMPAASGALVPPPASPFGAAAPAAPPAPPASLPTTPPTRRPDPGYRPGGTSSYRPAKTILVGEPDRAAAVRTAAFESPAEPVRQ
jgi:hypothetical protein